MKSDIVSKAIGLVSSAPELGPYLTAIPEAVVMPFAQEHDKHYLCIVLHITEEKVSREALARFCSHAISLLASTGVLHDLQGIELFLGSANKRLMRLSVLAESCERASHLMPEDLNEGISSPGITCIMYQPWPV
ncbi:hypothetical protein [Viridibacterium curvum]|uniref:hypothetical protein n=1 Tax=Viridibacterium curvum TaxID=1101404 RepID=UPI0031E9B3E1